MRILHVVEDVGKNEIMKSIMSIYKELYKNDVQFDFICDCCSNDVYNEEILSLGGKIFYFPYTESGKIKKFIGAYYMFKSFSDYSAVHIHLSSCINIGKLFAAKLAKIKNIILNSHIGMNSYGLWGNIRNKINRTYITKIFNKCIADSDTSGEYVFKKNYVRIYTGISIEAYKYNSEVRKKMRRNFKMDGKVVIGFCGELNKTGNCMQLPEVFKYVSKYCPNTMIVVIGDGIMYEALKKKVNKMHISKKIRLLGDRHDKSRLLQAMDVFIYFPTMKMMSSEIIAAQASGLTCIVNDKTEGGVLFSRNCYKLSSKSDLSKWAEAIVYSLKNVNRYEASELAFQCKFDIAHTADAVMQFYKDTIYDC